MTTARDIIVASLEDVGILGVGQTPLGEDLNYGLVRLNRMISQFNRRRWLVYHLVELVATASGQQTYTVGPSGAFNVASRPDRLENGCFFRQKVGAQAVDYPLTLIESRETYNGIALKSQGSWPQAVFYDAGSPLGTLYVYPVPLSGQSEIHILIKDTLAQLANLSTVLATPPEYEEAFEYNLALRFSAKYQIPASAEIAGLARASLATIRAANNQIQTLEMPSDLVGGGLRYNIFSDQSQ